MCSACIYILQPLQNRMKAFSLLGPATPLSHLSFMFTTENAIFDLKDVGSRERVVDSARNGASPDRVLHLELCFALHSSCTLLPPIYSISVSSPVGLDAICEGLCVLNSIIMISPVESSIFPSCFGALAWSPDGELAVAGGDQIYILVRATG